MHRVVCTATVVVCGLAITACGSKSSPAAPTPSAPTVTKVTLSVNPPAIGQTVQATATATLSDGTTAAVTSGFGGDTLTVASVSASGSILGLRTGAITVWADYQGVRGTKLLTVLPNYGGTFTGSYMLSGCQQTGDFATVNFCGSVPIGNLAPISLGNTQSADLQTVTGSFMLGSVSGSGTGLVAPDGSFSYSGSIVQDTLHVNLQNWQSVSTNPGSITGQFEQQWTDVTAVGSVRITCTALTLTKVASTNAVRPSRPAPSASLADLLQRMFGR
jgi:hypothetical protein